MTETVRLGKFLKGVLLPLVIVATLALLVLALTNARPSGILPVIVRAVTVSGDYAYVAVEGQGLRILDVSDPAKPKEAGFYKTLGEALGLAVSGNTIYVADGEEGLRIIDISNRMHPVEIGFYDTPGTALGLAISGNVIYVADLDQGLRIIDVSNPASPREIGFYDTQSGAMSLLIARQLAYIADGWDGLRLIDISDPTHPTEVGFSDYIGFASGLEVMGNYAYIASDMCLCIVDISKLENAGEIGLDPNEVNRYYTSGSQAIALAGHFAYLAAGQQGLRIIDLSDPANPREIGFYDTIGSASDVTVVRNTAYIADWDGGLRIIDTTEPTHPRELGFYQKRGLAGNLALADYVLRIFTLTGIAAALFVHWLSWFIRLRYLSVATKVGLVVLALFVFFTLLLVVVFVMQPAMGADGAYIVAGIVAGLWIVLVPFALIIGSLQARSLSAPWWKGVLSLFFEVGLVFLIGAGFNFMLRSYIRLPETGLTEVEYEQRFLLSFVIVLVALELIRPLVRFYTRRAPCTG